MDQLVVLQEIYESFAKGREVLHTIDPRSIEGECADLIRQLLEVSRRGEVDEDLCKRLASRLSELYEIKRLGDICRLTGLFEIAIFCYNKALSMTRDQGVRSVLLNNLGGVYARQGDMERAAKSYKEAAEGFQRAGDISGLAHVLGSLGSAYRRAGEWERAVEYCQRSLKTFEQLGDEYGTAQMTGSLGRVYAEMDELDLASLYYGRSLKDFQRLGDKRSAAWVLNRLGRIEAEGQRWEESIRCYNQSLSLFQELGQEQSTGTVLANLGRMYLDKGDAKAARESLERALKIIRREMQPVYQNTAACLAASYASLARHHSRNAGELKLSSQYYARASDRYQELAALSRPAISELKVAAGISRSLSYLASLEEGGEEEPVALAERAISSLEMAAAYAEGKERARIEAAQRTLAGMKELYSLSLMRNEPWNLTRSVTHAIEYLLGSACSLGDEACSSICDALRSMGGAMEEERRRRSPAEQLRSASSSLRRAEKRFEALGTELGRESADRTRKAALLIDRLVGIEPSGSAASSRGAPDLLNYRAHRGALLMVGWVLLRNALAGVDRTDCIYSWDDSLNLVESGPAGHPGARQRIKVPGRPIREPIREVFPREEGPVSGELLLEIGKGSVHKDPSPDGGWIEPVRAELVCSCAGQTAGQEAGGSYRVDRFPTEPVHERSSPEERSQGDGSGLSAEPQVVWDSQERMERKEVSLPSRGGHIFTRSKAIKLVKALFALVMVLLAIDMILYLI